MAWMTDSLRSAIQACGRLNPFARYGTTTGIAGVFNNQLAVAAYMSSGLLRKVIAIPAADRTQKWRDWQTDKDTIALIEKEEKRLGLRAKTKQCEMLRGIGGGAMILVTAGDHSSELKPESIAKGGLIAVNVVSRWQIQGEDWARDISDPLYGQPRMFRIDGDGQQKRIHPSRVVCFRGEPLPAGAVVPMEEAFWGDSRLLRVFNEVMRADETQAWFAALVKKAKLLRIGIGDLDDYMGTEEGRRKLDSRIALIAEGESSLNATVYRLGATSGDGADRGEAISDYQITWAGIPAVMDAFNQQVAAVADIPVTRLFGRSPGGMNATGEHDTDNWNDAVSDGQENETRPCLEQIDPLLLRSAGVPKPDEATWKWAPLWTPTEQQEAETFDKTMDALVKLQNTGTIPERAFAEGLQNLMEEREYIPGLGAALAKIPEAERFPEPEPDDTDPSALREGGDPDLAGGGGAGGSGPARRANDGGAPTGDLPFADGKRSRRRGLKGRAGWNESDHPRGQGGKFVQKAGSSLSSQQRAIGRLVARVTANPGQHRVVDLGNAGSRQFPRYRRVIDNSGVNHALRSHGDMAAERNRIPKQHAIGARDFQAVPRIVAAAGTPTASGTPKGAKGLRLIYTAQVGGYRYELVEQVQPRNRALALKTLKKWKV